MHSERDTRSVLHSHIEQNSPSMQIITSVWVSITAAFGCVLKRVLIFYQSTRLNLVNQNENIETFKLWFCTLCWLQASAHNYRKVTGPLARQIAWILCKKVSWTFHCVSHHSWGCRVNCSEREKLPPRVSFDSVPDKTRPSRPKAPKVANIGSVPDCLLISW